MKKQESLLLIKEKTKNGFSNVNKTTFDLSTLWPSFSLIFNGEIKTGSGISTLFVLALIIITGIFFVYAIYGYITANRQTRFYTKLISNIDKNKLSQKRRDIRNDADKHNDYSHLWREFDESLVQSSDGKLLFNTLDSAHFFNTSSLASNLTQNRLLAAVPGFLTAIGVVGTFVGLQLALSQLQLQQNAGIDELRDGIGSLINGASIAFMTSIWGVSSSLLFNFVEKILERSIREKIHQLQNSIDYLFPRINAEQSLVNISKYSQSADETLKGLAEKIGDKLQEALAETTGSIRTGLEGSLAPVIQTLVNNANQRSEQALEGLLKQFMRGMGKAVNSQRLMTEQTSTTMLHTVNDMGTQMQSFITQLEKQQNNSHQATETQQKTSKKQFEQFDQIAKSFEIIAAENSKASHSILQSSQQMNSASNRLEILSTNVKEAANVIAEPVEKLMESNQQVASENKLVFEKSKALLTNLNHTNDQFYQVSQTLLKATEHAKSGFTTLDQHLGSFKNFIPQLEKQQNNSHQAVETQQKTYEKQLEKFDQLVESLGMIATENSKSSHSILQSSQQMNSASNQLGALSTNVKEAANAIAKPVEKLMESNHQVASENKLVFEQSKALITNLNHINDQFHQVSQTLLKATEHAESGFTALDQHLESFESGLKNHINELEKELSNLLKGYSEQVQNQTHARLNEWNDQTREYTTTMKDVVNSMATVIDEIEAKSERNYA